MEAGYLGVGNMGQPMAHKLLDAGHNLTMFDISEAAMRPLLERQARRAASPQELGDRCQIVFVPLPTLGAFRDAVLGPNGLAHGNALKVLVNTCTVGVPFVKEIEQAMAARGVALVDCPISGGPAGARAGTLSVMVSESLRTRCWGKADSNSRSTCDGSSLEESGFEPLVPLTPKNGSDTGERDAQISAR